MHSVIALGLELLLCNFCILLHLSSWQNAISESMSMYSKYCNMPKSTLLILFSEKLLFSTIFSAFDCYKNKTKQKHINNRKRSLRNSIYMNSKYIFMWVIVKSWLSPKVCHYIHHLKYFAGKSDKYDAMFCSKRCNWSKCVLFHQGTLWTVWWNLHVCFILSYIVL